MSLKNRNWQKMNGAFLALFTLSQFSSATAMAGNSNPQHALSINDIKVPTEIFSSDVLQKNNKEDKPSSEAGGKVRAPINSATPVAAPAAPGGSPGKPTMGIATVPDEYACPLFDNRPNAELIQAIDSLNKQVQSNPGCKEDASATQVTSNTDALKTNLMALRAMTQQKDLSKLSMTDLETAVTGALGATQNLGSIFSNETFLRSTCGAQTMSTGNALLSLNSILNGLGPYALMAVSMNAALAPALPFVIGGMAVTSGISTAAKMGKERTLDMSKPEFRKALLQNTCQFIKVSKKVRFMELAQSGKIRQITQELQNNIKSYEERFAKPSRELFSLLRLKDASEKQLAPGLAQIQADRQALNEVDSQITPESDSLMICTYAHELAKVSDDATKFPTSVVSNMASVIATIPGSSTVQASTLQSMHKSSITRINALFAKAESDDNALKLCAKAGTDWLTSLRQAVGLTASLIEKEQKSVDAELGQNAEYRQWRSQYSQVQIEQVTVDRVQKALEALAQNNSLIDRSELSQRISTLKAGLFGSNGFKLPLMAGSPPVLAWLEYTKEMFDQEAAQFMAGFAKLKEGDMSFSTTGKHPKADLIALKILSNTQNVSRLENAIKANMADAEKLVNINLTTLPLNSRRHEIACQQLESAWLNWSAALDHLGATQLFCNMIDGVLDVSVDKGIMEFCRGKVDLNGHIDAASTVNATKTMLVQKGYQGAAIVISMKLKELQCPMPTVSVMNK